MMGFKCLIIINSQVLNCLYLIRNYIALWKPILVEISILVERLKYYKKLKFYYKLCY